MTTRKTRGPGGKSVLPRSAQGGSGPRRGGPRQGGPRQGGPRQGGPRPGGPRQGGPRRFTPDRRERPGDERDERHPRGDARERGERGRPERRFGERGPREDRPRSDRPRSDRPRSDRPRSDRPRSDRPRSDRPRSDRPGGGRFRDERGPRSDQSRGGRFREDRPRRDDRRGGEGRPRREDRPRGDRSREDRPRGDRSREERGPRRDDRARAPGRDDRARGAGRDDRARGPRRDQREFRRDDRDRDRAPRTSPGRAPRARDERPPRRRPGEATGRRFARPTRFDAGTGRAVETGASTATIERERRPAPGPTAPAAAAPRRGPNVRDLALQCLFQVHAKRAFAERVIDDLAEQFRLDPRDRGFLNELVKGALRRQGTLDWQLDRLVHQGLASLPLWIQDDLRLGAYQLLYLDRIPPRAVVDEAVKLGLKYGHPGTAGLSNSVLRRLADAVGAGELPEPSPTHEDGTPDLDGLMAITSHPRWLLERWVARYGLEDTIALCQANNRAAALGLRVNRLKLDRKELLKRLAAAGLTAHEGRWTQVSVSVPADANFANFPSYARGDCTVQDESETLVGLLVAPRSGERVLDMCAAPGGKSSHLAELMGDTGEIVSVEKMPARARSMERQMKRLGLRSVHVVTADGEEANLPALGAGGPYDRALVDAPCSSLGVLARRADARWRKEASGFAELAEHQGRLLRASAAAVKPGGVLVYSVCSFEPEETDDVVNSFLAGHPEWTRDDAAQFVPAELVEPGGALRVLPHRSGTDGAYAVRLVRQAGA